MSKNAIIVGLVVVAVAGIALWKVGSKAPKTVSLNERLISELYDKNLKDWQVRDVLIRLSTLGDPEALKFCLNNPHPESPALRAGVAEALGAFETDASMALLEKLLQDSDPKVRLGAFRGLALKQTPVRVKLIREQIARKDLSEEETLKLKEVLFRASDDPSDRKLAVDALVAFARSGNTPDHIKAGLMAASLDRHNPKVLSYIKEKVKENREPALVSSGIYLLAEKKDQDVAKNLRSYLRNPQSSVRIAALQTIPKYCQSDRFTALKEFFASERDPAVIRTASQTLQYMGKSAVPVLEGAQRSGRLTGDALNSVNTALGYLRTQTVDRDPCGGRR